MGHVHVAEGGTATVATVRILHVINQLAERAGAELSLLDILTDTQGGGFQHAVVVLRREMGALEPLVARGIPVFQPARARLGWAGKARHVRKAITAFRPDLVHTTLFEADLVGRVAAKLGRVPALTSLVNTPYVPAALDDREVSARKLKLAERVDRVLSRHATTAFHAISGAVADEYAARFGIDRSRIHVVPRGRDPDRLGVVTPQRRAAVRRRLGLADQAPVVLNIGRQEPQKGQRYLIEALLRIRQRFPEATVMIAGRSGNSTQDLQRLVSANRLETAVHFLGVRDDIGDLLVAADVFAFPSLYEGLGGALLEAMAVCVPIVAADSPAVREVLAGGACGLLVPPGESVALADAVCSVLDDRESARNRTEAARRRFEEHYSRAAMVDGMARLYRSLIVGQE